MDKWKKIDDTLENLKENNLFRQMNVIETAQNSHIKLQTSDGSKDLIMFASNSYLDMCNHPVVKEYVHKVIDEFGIGSGGSRLTTGNTTMHMMLEDMIAKYKKREAAIVINTGYMANLGAISALCGKEDIIFSDELNHASIIDGCRLSKAKLVVYKHNDMEDLEQKIRENNLTDRTALIVSDGVFSMDGDIVNLPELVRIADKYGALSMIDEAHATGVIGKTGGGTEEYYGMEGKVDVLMGTLSKAIGSEGGFVCGSNRLIQYLINKCRSFIFSTSLSPATEASSYMSIKYIMEHQERVEKLHSNIEYFCRCLEVHGITAKSLTAIFPIIIGDEGRAMECSNKLRDCGYYISAIRYPTVAKGKARLRVALMSSHTETELADFAKAISEVIK